MPRTSGCPLLAASAIKAQIAGTALADVCVAPNAVLIGIPVGPHASISATCGQLAKYRLRCREISELGLAPGPGYILAKILADPVLHHVCQFYPLGPSAPRIAQIALQGFVHIPHHGFSSVVLRSLCMLGLPDMIDIQIASAGLALSAARRYESFAIGCNERLQSAFALS